MKVGFSVVDITPRVGVELFGYGPFFNRKSDRIREPLEARCIALASDGKTIVIVNLDLGGITPWCVETSKKLIREKHPELADDDILIACSHTHTGPGVSSLGRAWGTPDPVWENLLPYKIAKAADEAMQNPEDVTMSAAVVPCEGVGINRVYDKGGVEYTEGRKPTWRPEHPELTDTVTTVVKFTRGDGSLAGFITNFGAHPVVSGLSTAISGDYPAVAIHNIMRTIPGSTGLFLQGALGDVNACIVGDPVDRVDIPMINLNIIAGRFEAAVRKGLETAQPVKEEHISVISEDVAFDIRAISEDFIEETRKGELAKFAAPDATEKKCGMAAAILDGIELLRKFQKENPDGKRHHRLHLMKIGPVTLFGAPLEMFQAIKRDVCSGSTAEFPVIVSLADGEYGYAPDSVQTSKGDTYESKISPMVCGTPPFVNVHKQLVENFLRLEKEMR